MLEHLHNKHQGQRLFIIGTGPSLTEKQLDMVKNEITWGVNHLCEHTEFVPTYYAMSDFRETQTEDIRRKLEKVIEGKQTIAYYSLNYQETVKPLGISGWTHIPLAPPDRRIIHGFIEGLDDKFEHIHLARDVVMEIPLQLGLWMGFKSVYLIGTDYSPSRHFYDTESRFSGGGSKKQGQTLHALEVAYKLVTRAKRKLINCTPNSQATARSGIPYISLEEVLNGLD